MMYLKQFPDICREMGFDVEEKEKIVTLCVTDINCSININKKLFLEDLELTLDSYSEVCVAIAVFEAKAKAGKYDNLDATELQKLKCVFDKAWETGRLKDDTGMFQTEVDACHQHAECLKAVLEKLLEKLKKEVDTGLTGADITHENEERYRFSFDFDENCPADNSEPRVHATYDFWKGDDEESVEWAVFEVTTDKPFFLLSYEEYESIELTGFYDSFDEAFEEMKELIAESVNDVFDEDATADDVEDMEDYNVFVHSNKDSKDSGAPLAFASFCDDYPNREWTIFHI